jgi:hypothetical protein
MLLRCWETLIKNFESNYAKKENVLKTNLEVLKSFVCSYYSQNTISFEIKMLLLIFLVEFVSFKALDSQKNKYLVISFYSYSCKAFLQLEM